MAFDPDDDSAYDIYRSSPFEFAETSAAGQCVISIGRTVIIGDALQVSEPLGRATELGEELIPQDTNLP